mmetsp:Transcript_28149/g.76896  ORF Transcript_28149/g.76896 Transcript_28149/m.76896 type:complete len:99 (+) Transcript_28149:204-500(+)|eukprot:scaffold303978_cov26-Tisochrysis_lutea.AAC.2
MATNRRNRLHPPITQRDDRHCTLRKVGSLVCTSYENAWRRLCGRGEIVSTYHGCGSTTWTADHRAPHTMIAGALPGDLEIGANISDSRLFDTAGKPAG